MMLRHRAGLVVAVTALTACGEPAAPMGLEIEAGPVHVLPVDTVVQWSVRGSEGGVLSWTSDDPHVATVEGGTVTTLAPGRTTIRASGSAGADAVELLVAPRTRGLLMIHNLGPYVEGPWARLEVYDPASRATSTVAETRGGFFTGARYSPDGDRIAASVNVRQDSTWWALRTDIVVMNADGTSQQRLTAAADHEHFEHPSWSPDGRRIAFVRSLGSTESFHRTQQRIGIMSDDGSGVEYLITGVSPKWSPDGRYILHGSTGVWEREGGFPILDVESGIVLTIPLPENPACGDPGEGIVCASIENADWTPDGNLVLAWSNGPEGDGAYVLSLETAETTKVGLEAGTFDTQVAPDGSAVAVSYMRGGSINSEVGVRLFGLDGIPLGHASDSHREGLGWRPGAR